ncbi:MAG: hypothetical protein IJJ38_02975 [Lachnospiraceae bacterium]|nr:hypothetical protein [Lachnospiraceae bacterium]
MAVVRFLLFNYPDNIAEVPFTFVPGMTVREVAETCAKMDGVTAPAEGMLEAGCMVDGRYVANDYIFTGSENAVEFMNQIGDG